MLSRHYRYLPRIKERIVQAAIDAGLYVEKHHISMALIGVLGFPAYYLVWTYVFPQPYESLLLRLLGVLIFLPAFLIPVLPGVLRRLLPVYGMFIYIYALPFFFTFMLLMNDTSAVWGMSTIAAILLLFLFMEDWLAINIVFLVGSVVGWLCFVYVRGEIVLPYGYLEQLPIYIFALLGGSIFNYNSEQRKQERLRAMQAIGSNIAHELRTPMQGIQSGMVGLQKYLPPLLESYQMARAAGIAVPEIRKRHFVVLEHLIERINNETVVSNNMIDMLLTNAGKLKINKEEFGYYSMRHCIHSAIDRYPFSSNKERAKVVFEEGVDFDFYGSELLFCHVIFNLLKNALWFASRSGEGIINISMFQDDDTNKVIVKDTGTGIEPFVLPHIFEQFYSTKDSSQGTGIGLCFCKEVVESFGGSIVARSEYGSYAEFIISFRRGSDE